MRGNPVAPNQKISQKIKRKVLLRKMLRILLGKNEGEFMDIQSRHIIMSMEERICCIADGPGWWTEFILDSVYQPDILVSEANARVQGFSLSEQSWQRINIFFPIAQLAPRRNTSGQLVRSSRELQYVCLSITSHRRYMGLAAGQHAMNASL